MTNKRLNFVESLQDAPIIAAVKNDDGLEKALASDCAAIFFLYGTILNIGQLTERAKSGGKLVFVHIDLIEGLTGKDISVDFIAQNTQADGIISTRINLIRHAKNLGLITIQRFFLLDSLSFENVVRQSSYADAVDILPGTMPRVIERLMNKLRQPIIASGLIIDKQDIMSALSAGALAVSTTSELLWFA
ncbi:glycerol-3-phosphate responsive antiterminator [Butyricicoccus sp.]|uniref:glycerol-3-phosphate responsive antiterminator n=1 Tax=Butyricicoccus sp. TaxID=2049021 RepID=UPI003F190BDF